MAGGGGERERERDALTKKCIVSSITVFLSEGDVIAWIHVEGSKTEKSQEPTVEI